MATQTHLRETELRLQKEIEQVRREVEQVRLEIKTVEVHLTQAIHRQTVWVIGSSAAVIGGI